MKKILLLASATMLVIVAVVTSCKKEEPVAAKLPTGKIVGTAYANLDKTNDSALTAVNTHEEREFAPSGTKVVAQVDPKDYTSATEAAAITYEKIVYEATVGSNGAFSFDTIKAYGNNVNVTLIYSDFVSDQKVSSTKNVKKVFSAPNQTVSVVANQTQMVEPTYN